MGSEWTEHRLGDLVSHQKGHAFKSKDYREQGHGIVRVSDFTDRSVATDSCNYLAEELAHNYDSVALKQGDVVIATVGSWPTNPASVVGKTIRVPREADSFLLNQNAVKLTANAALDQTFLFHLLKTETFGAYIVSAAQGSASQASITLKSIFDYSLQLPPLPEQKAIAHILGSLDDKIELNRRMNATLEGMAQALFKSWFVDFDPVIDNALAAGNPIPDELVPRAEVRKNALANGTTQQGSVDHPTLSDPKSHFPAAFQFTEELGWIPEGWEAKPFGDLLESTIGGDWGKETEDEKHSFRSVIIRGTDMPHILAGKRSSAPERWVEPKKFSTRELRDSDIVIEISGGSPTQSTGRSLFITDNILRRLGGSVEPASFCRRFRPVNQFYGVYGGLHLAVIYNEGKMWEYQNQSTGISNFQTTSFLEREFVAIPFETNLLEVFYTKVRPFFDKMTSNQQEELAKLRDTLLPKLISGELRIPEAEKLTEEALT